MNFTEASSNKQSEDVVDFLKSRRTGAKESAASAKQKGGDAIVSYYHFAAKDQPYGEITGILKSEGLDEAKKLCKRKYKELLKAVDLDMTQKEYQAIVGKIEVYGECYIRFLSE
jgi:hypothetical protein